MLVLSVSAFSQTNQTNNIGKVVLIDTSVLTDNQQGIKVWIKLRERYTNELKAQYLLRYEIEDKIVFLKNEINHLQIQRKPINDKTEELQKLTEELKNAQETEAKRTERTKRYQSLAKPIAEKIIKKMKEFAREKGYSVIIDKFQNGKFVDGEIEDVTKTFIQFCNESFEKEKSQ